MTDFEAAQIAFRQNPNQETADIYENAAIADDDLTSIEFEAAISEIVKWEREVRDINDA